MSTLMSLLLLSLASSGADGTAESAKKTAMQKPECINEPVHVDSVTVLLINEPHGFKLTWCHLYEQQPSLD